MDNIDLIDSIEGKVLNKYKIISILGTGSYSQVYKAVKVDDDQDSLSGDSYLAL